MREETRAFLRILLKITEQLDQKTFECVVVAAARCCFGAMNPSDQRLGWPIALDSDDFVLEHSFGESPTAARGWKHRDNARGWFYQPAGLDAMSQIVTDFVHQGLQVLLRRKNLDD